MAGLRRGGARRRAPAGDLPGPRRRLGKHCRRTRRPSTRGHRRCPHRRHVRDPHRRCAGRQPLARAGPLRVRGGGAGQPGRAPGGTRRRARAAALPAAGGRERSQRRDRRARARRARPVPAGAPRARGRQPPAARAGAGAARPRGPGGGPPGSGAVPRGPGRRTPQPQLGGGGDGPVAGRGADGARAGGGARRRAEGRRGAGGGRAVPHRAVGRDGGLRRGSRPVRAGRGPPDAGSGAELRARGDRLPTADESALLDEVDSARRAWDARPTPPPLDGPCTRQLRRELAALPDGVDPAVRALARAAPGGPGRGGSRGPVPVRHPARRPLLPTSSAGSPTSSPHRRPPGSTPRQGTPRSSPS